MHLGEESWSTLLIGARRMDGYVQSSDVRPLTAACVAVDRNIYSDRPQSPEPKHLLHMNMGQHVHRYPQRLSERVQQSSHPYTSDLVSKLSWCDHSSVGGMQQPVLTFGPIALGKEVVGSHDLRSVEDSCTGVR
jgi:hypothetical protein